MAPAPVRATGSPSPRRPMRRYLLFGLWVALALLALVPLAGDRQTVSLWTTALIFAGVSSGWAIAGGLSGLIPLGHAAFFGVGAYSSALVFAKYDWNPWLGIGLGVVMSAALAWLMTALAVRFKVKGAYFGLYTLAWGEMLRIIASNWDYVGKTNGVLIPFKPEAGVAQMQFSDPRGFYVVALAYGAFSMAVFALVKWSPLGWRLSAIRGDEATASASGINVSRSLSACMAISGGVTSIGGGLYAHYIQFIDPELGFNVSVSIDIAVRAILGGETLVLGPFLGSAAMTNVSEFAHDHLGDLPQMSLLIVGVAIIALAHWFPRGIAGVGLQLGRLVLRRRGSNR
ncbi:branched-chain amino acid ABC transporter permease [Nocardioides sp. PD653-B2]|uniref:branched-chain amino acid ABC transporter permease n=1 Tax=Nocardioides sp. PD653-B2 TaxID=1892811 RepID=UPI0013FD7B3E|nr:branched-chain amino acid ABC transporter permease [Nocardioides sp. PD653-B2]